MSIIRTLLNNGFFVLLLVVAVTLYLAYSDDIKRDHGLLPEQTAEMPTESVNDAANTEEVASDTSNEMTMETKPTAVEVVEVAKAEKVVETSEPVASAPVQATTTQPEVKEATPAPSPAQTATETVTDSTPETLAVNETLAEDKAPSQTAETQPEPSEAKAKPQTTSASQNHDEVLKQFASPQEAINAARSAFYNKDYDMAEKIYFAMAFKTQKADVIGELANVLYVNKKIDWAKQAWLEAASQLVEENRVQDAMVLSNRLAPIAPKTSQKIAQNIQRLTQHNNQASQPKMPSMAEQKARMQAYQAKMQAYQQKMQQRYSQPAPNMPKTAPAAPSIAEQKARAEAYRKQVEAYQTKMRAYHEAQRQKIMQQRQPSQPMPGNYPYNPNMNSAP